MTPEEKARAFAHSNQHDLTLAPHRPASRGEVVSKLDEMIEAEVIRICKERSGDDVSMCTCGATSEMATLLRSDTAFRAMCEERLERLEYERNATEETYLESADWRGLEYSRDEGTIGSLDRQISALRTLLEG